MVYSQTSVRTSRLEKGQRSENFYQSNKMLKFTARNVLEKFGNRLFGSRNSFETKEPVTYDKELSLRDKVEKPVIPGKDSNKKLCYGKQKEDLRGYKTKNDRDFRRLKTKYNNSFGNIFREWVNLIYSILILRMNLIKFIVDKYPEFGHNDIHLQKQILLESKTIYKIVSKAQHYSQEQFLYMWSHLDKLITNRMVLKNALESIQMNEANPRDWKTASDKVNLLQEELEKAQATYKSIYKTKNHFELMAKEKLIKLENISNSKSAELERLVQKITEVKNKEVQMRGKLLLNLKSYRDLKSKKQSLMNIENEMKQLKSNQEALMQDYAAKIQTLKSQVEAKEKEIKAEKEEKKKIKASLVGFGDISRKQGFLNERES